MSNKYQNQSPQLPCVHTNGTSGGELADQLQGARSALTVAIMALYGTGPNGRDYYPLGDEAFTLARSEYFDRCHRLESVGKELEAIQTALLEQNEAREEMRRPKLPPFPSLVEKEASVAALAPRGWSSIKPSTEASVDAALARCYAEINSRFYSVTQSMAELPAVEEQNAIRHLNEAFDRIAAERDAETQEGGAN